MGWISAHMHSCTAGVEGQHRSEDGSGRDADRSGDPAVSDWQRRQSGFLQSGMISCIVCETFSHDSVTVAKLCLTLRCAGRRGEEHDRDPGEEPSGWSDRARAGGALLASRLVGPSAAAALGAHSHRRVPGADGSEASLHSAGVQQGACCFSAGKTAHAAHAWEVLCQTFNFLLC